VSKIINLTNTVQRSVYQKVTSACIFYEQNILLNENNSFRGNEKSTFRATTMPDLLATGIGLVDCRGFIFGR